MTLKEILSIINFRSFDKDGRQDTDIVRIYLDFPSHFFEIGFGDFSDEMEDTMYMIFKKDILDRKIAQIRCEGGYIHIHLEDEDEDD